MAKKRSKSKKTTTAKKSRKPKSRVKGAGTTTRRAKQASSSTSPKRPPAAKSVPTIHRLYGALKAGASDDQLNDLVRELISEVLRKHPVADQYNLLILFDKTRLMRTDADRIYRSITKFAKKKPILLVLCSSGGEIDAAYFISKLCREYAEDKFIVAVPREAKSAATLICCGADEIHMGSLSELGPIDPQIKNRPALALKQSVEHLAELTKTYPTAQEMFATFLSKSLELSQLGYYERIAESAVQYAERLIAKRLTKLSKPANKIAHNLVYAYKDHGFVIDVAEAETVFDKSMIKHNSSEYRLSDALYERLKLIERYFRLFANKGFYFVGSQDSDAGIYDLK
ncbi:MAG: hypothetical protein IH984_14880 [Planctomycetes bacterium]|nr:hypothetical protein [Planctomycetota bacterium]